MARSLICRLLDRWMSRLLDRKICRSLDWWIGRSILSVDREIGGSIDR